MIFLGDFDLAFIATFLISSAHAVTNGDPLQQAYSGVQQFAGIGGYYLLCDKHASIPIIYKYTLLYAFAIYSG